MFISPATWMASMARGEKSAYTSKQRRRARHIEESYEDRGVSGKESARRAWATVNKEEGGGKKSGSGRGKKPNRSASKKGGKKGGRASASRPKAARSASARKAAATRKRGGRKTTRSRKSTRKSTRSR
jgi:hypothetical protein